MKIKIKEFCLKRINHLGCFRKFDRVHKLSSDIKFEANITR